MKREERVILDRQGVDKASETIQNWLEEVKAEHKDILRIRLLMEELLDSVRRYNKQPPEAVLRLIQRSGSVFLVVRYGGERFDPTQTPEDAVSELRGILMPQLGLEPEWRWRNQENELIQRVSRRHMRPEQLMLGCIAAAIAVGLAGPLIPSAVRTGIIDYGLSFLSGGFLDLLNTFIGVMVFLSVISGICGIDDASVLGKVGKRMLVRFVTMSFALCVPFTIIARFCFPLASGSSGAGSQVYSILSLLFGILPSNPIKPFLEGNTLQIVVLAGMVGTILVVSGSQTAHLRTLITELYTLVMRCVTAVCVFLPVFIFSSLVSQLWTGGVDLFFRFGKPLLLCIVLCFVSAAVYLVVACMKLRVRISVVLPKLIPDFLIAFFTSSSAAALPHGMETNEKKLGIDPSFNRMSSPIGTILFAGQASLIFVLNTAFLAEYFGVQVNIGWWFTVWFVSSLLSMSVPPVAGGTISCLAVMLAQMGIPQQGLAIAVALATVMDFFTTSFRVLTMHLEIALQADDLKLLNHEILEKN